MFALVTLSCPLLRVLTLPNCFSFYFRTTWADHRSTESNGYSKNKMALPIKQPEPQRGLVSAPVRDSQPPVAERT